jgi:hypothetical protein
MLCIIFTQQNTNRTIQHHFSMSGRHIHTASLLWDSRNEKIKVVYFIELNRLSEALSE